MPLTGSSSAGPGRADSGAAHLPCGRQAQRLEARVGHTRQLERSKLLSLLGQAMHHCSLADSLRGWLSPNLQEAPC